MEFTAAQIAGMLEGSVEGDEQVSVSRLSKIEEGTPGSLSFLANPQYTPFIYETKASVVIVNDSFAAERPVAATMIRVPDAYSAFARLLELYDQIKHDKKGISQQAFIDGSAEIGDDVYIGEFSHVGSASVIGAGSKVYPQAFIGDRVRIGKGVLIHPGVRILSDSVIGDQVTLHSGVVIGGDGFGFAPNSEKYEKVAQIGNVVIEDHVEIGANTTIDRATLGSTIIRKGVKLDNLIQVAHNVEIGAHTVIAAQTGIAGSTSIGAYCMIGGQVGIAGHIKIGDRVKIAAQSGIQSDLADEKVVMGSPAFDFMEYKKAYIYFRKLHKLLGPQGRKEKKKGE
jgi:UDP-3-O-[3-hydroxymyristoyl] glucosamine N-acyltransferase